MHWFNKIAWSEGLFLRPQLFQQQERYLEQYAHRRAALAGPFFWGFRSYEIDTNALALGKIGLAQAAGMFSDGTSFMAPEDTAVPEPFAARQEHAGQLICLAVQGRNAGADETTFDNPGTPQGRVSATARFSVFDVELRDSNSFGQGAKPVQLCNLRLRVMPVSDAGGGLLGLPFARIGSVGSDGSLVLDPNFVPPCAGYGASGALSIWLTHLHAICRQRAESLAARLTSSDGRAQESAEVADFLLLQVLNRSDAVLEHLLAVRETPPEQIYLLLRGLSAELSTFVRTDSRRPPLHRPYLHGHLQTTFTALVADVQSLLNEVLVRSARRVTLEHRPHNVRVASVGPAELQTFSGLVFAVAADMPPDRLAIEFAQHCKVAPSDRLAELIRAHVPGIALQLLPVPPRQIPFNAGFVYFQLEAHGELWEHLLKTGGIALHLGTEFPGLKLELWGVSRK